MKKLILFVCVFALPCMAQELKRSDHYFAACAANKVFGCKTINKFGNNTDIDTGAAETVWSAGGDYPWSSLATAQALELVSDSANDAAAGTGCRSVNVQGLDTNYDEQNENVTPNGITAVDLANTYLRVFRLKCTSAGSGGQNAGTITVRLDGAGQVVATIDPTNNQSLMAVWTVPAGYTALCTGYYKTVNKANSAAIDALLYARPEGEVFQLKHKTGGHTQGSTDSVHTFDPKLSFAEKTDLELKAISSANNTDISGGFDCYYMKD